MLDTTMHTHTHTINVNKACALQQTTGKTGTKHRLCEIDVNITNGVIFFTHHEQCYIDMGTYAVNIYGWLMCKLTVQQRTIESKTNMQYIFKIICILQSLYTGWKILKG